jgi:membrane fusion protein (multidrug efflux system)
LAFSLGDRVRRGDVLIRQDARLIEVGLAAARARLTNLQRQLEAAKAEAAALERARQERQQANLAAVEEAEATVRAAEVEAEQAESEASSLRTLSRRGHVPALEAERAESAASASHAAEIATRLGVERLRKNTDGLDSEARATLAARRRQVADYEAERERLGHEIRRLEIEIDRHLVRAPVDGVIGEIGPLRRGSIGKEGDRCAVIVPEGDLKVVAAFVQRSAVGRLHPGLSARVRLAGFSWVEHGSLGAQVTRVGTEGEGGAVRVELGLVEPTSPSIPLQHGLAAHVDVEVDRTSPAALLMRAIGAWSQRP